MKPCPDGVVLGSLLVENLDYRRAVSIRFRVLMPPRADPCVDAKHLIAPVRQSSNLPQGKESTVVNPS